MRISVLLVVLLAFSAAIPAASGHSGNHGATAQDSIDSSREQSPPPEWNVTVNQTAPLDNVLGTSAEYTFAAGKMPSTSGISPGVYVYRNDTREYLAHLVVDKSEWTDASPKYFTGRVVGDTLFVRYKRTLSAVTKRGGEWKQYDLGPIDGKFQGLFASESAAYVASGSGVTKYGVDGEPNEIAHYETEFRLQAASYANDSITFQAVDATDCQSGASGGCSSEIDDGTRYGALDEGLDERWTQLAREEWLVSERLGDLLITNPGSTATFTARDVETGQAVWTWEAPNSGYIVESLRGDAHFWTNNNQEFIVNPDTGKEVWSYDNDDVLYDSPTRLLLYTDGAYELRDRATGDLLGSYEGPEPTDDFNNPDWRSLETIDGGEYLSVVVDPAPDRAFIDTETGEVVTTFDPGPRVEEYYEKQRKYADELDVALVTWTVESMGVEDSFVVDAGLRTGETDEYIDEEYVFARPSNHSWFRLNRTNNAGMAIGSPVQVNDVLLYSTFQTEGDAEGVERDNQLRVRDLNGTLLGNASLYRSDLQKPMREAKENPRRTLDNQYNELLTPENYVISVESRGSETDVLYVEPYGHEGDRYELQFEVQRIIAPDVEANVAVTCGDTGPIATLENPSQIPLVYSVGDERDVRLAAGTSKTVSLEAGSTYQFGVEMTTGHAVDYALKAGDGIGIAGEDILQTDCTPADSTTDTNNTTTESASTGASTPGFTVGLAGMALLTALCGRWALGEERF